MKSAVTFEKLEIRRARGCCCVRKRRELDGRLFALCLPDGVPAFCHAGGDAFEGFFCRFRRRSCGEKRPGEDQIVFRKRKSLPEEGGGGISCRSLDAETEDRFHFAKEYFL